MEPRDFIDYKVDLRPARRSWAPGQYSGKCIDCRQGYMGDKRAYMCADCAYRNWRPTHRHGPSGDTVVLLRSLMVMEGDTCPLTIYVLLEDMRGREVVWIKEKFQNEFAAI